MMDGGKAVKVGSDTDGVETDILNLIQTGSLAAVNELHDSGEWTDLEKAVFSTTTAATVVAPEITWHFTAMAWAAYFKQLEVMQWLIEKRARVDEDREWHMLPSNAAAGAGFIEGLELLKEKGCDLSKADSNGYTPCSRCCHVRSPTRPPPPPQLRCAHGRQGQVWRHTC